MISLLLRFWQWLGRLLGQNTKYEIRDTKEATTTPPPAAAGQPAAAQSPTEPAVTLPPPLPAQMDIHAGEQAQYGRKASLLTQPEGRLYRSLLTAVHSNYQVMSKVRLGDFLWLVNEPPDRKQHLSRLFCRHVDFLLCESLTLKPLLVIELDDYSHRTPYAIEADRYKNELFAAAGLPILRLNHPNFLPRQLRDRIERALDGEVN